MTDSVSASYLPVPHPIPSRKYPYPKSFHWLRSSSCFSNSRALLLTSRRHASPRRRFFLALPRGRTDNGFFWEDDFDEKLHDANSNTPRHPAHTGGGSRNESSGRSGGGPKLDSRRFVGRRRPSQTTTKFEYERFKDMFAEENVDMSDQAANAVGTPSLDAGRSRIALLSESQPSRLHNRFVVFERATESKLVRLSSKGDNSSSPEGTPAESASVPRTYSKLHRQKLSYNGQRKSSAKNLGKLSLNPGQEDTRDATSKSTSSNFSSKLQIILHNFNKRDGSPATEPPADNAVGSLGFQIGKDSRTESLEAQREDFGNPSTQATRGTRKGSQHSEETYPTFFESSVEEASEDERKTTGASAQADYEPLNLFSNAPPVPSERSELSSVSKFYIPIGKRRMGASSQQAHVSPRRLSRSIGSRSSPSRSSIPGRFSKYSKRPDSNDERGSGPYTSTSDSRSSPREEQPQFLLKSKEGFKSHASQELDEDTEKHHSAYGSSSAASFQESCIDVPAQSQTNFCPDVWYDSDVEIDVQAGSLAPTVVEEANLVSPLPEQLTSHSDVEDDVVNRSFISAAVVGINAMSSLPERSLLLSEESGPSTALSDPNLDAHVRSLGDNEVSGLTMSRAVTKQSAMPSWPALSTQSNLISSAMPDLDVESGNLQESSSASVSEAPGVGTKPDDIKDHPSSDLPFGFQYSYTETPNAPILRYREPQHSPFGPLTMGRPWTGRAPPKPSKKKLRMFDSFKPPPQGKKGVKYVQYPGPFPEGQIPKAARTREEILGEPLTKEEAMQLVEKCKNEKRQVNLGRDGLTHNMLDLVHSQWKRRRVCKIKCKGVPTVDMDNVYFHIEDKTGGKIIHRVGGVVFLFRGRNYNYKDRPKIPLMLWRPAAPVYPKLIQQTPGGLTKEQARQLRLLGRKTASIYRLGKNGVYLNLVKDVRNAFKVDDLVRIDCRGLNPSDYKKIGAKLKDLVPCVLISFDREHILLWKGRGQDPYSAEINSEDANTSSIDNMELEVANESSSSDLGPADSSISDIEMNVLCGEPSVSSHAADNAVLSCFGNRETSLPSCLNDTQFALVSSSSAAEDKLPLVNVNDPKSPTQVKDGFSEISQEEVKEVLDKDTSSSINYLEKQCLDKVDMTSNEAVLSEYYSRTWEDSREFGAGTAVDKENLGNSFMFVEVKEECSQVNNHSIRVTALWEQALESGMAIEIDEADLDTDSVGYKADEFAKTAPPGPTYTQNLLKKLRLKNVKRISDGESNIDISRMQIRPRQKKKNVKRAADFPFLEVPPMGGLPVDELARLLAPN